METLTFQEIVCANLNGLPLENYLKDRNDKGFFLRNFMSNIERSALIPSNTVFECVCAKFLDKKGITPKIYMNNDFFFIADDDWIVEQASDYTENMFSIINYNNYVEDPKSDLRHVMGCIGPVHNILKVMETLGIAIGCNLPY